MSELDSRITARIDSELYNKIQDNFHHGQQTKFFRNVFKSLEKIIEEDNFDVILDYLYKNKPLTLPGVGED